MKRLLSILIFSIFYQFVLSQTTSKPNGSYYIAPGILKSKFLRNLIIPDSNTQATVLGVTFQYLHCPQNNSLRSEGTHVNLILNVARFFTRKFILGFCFDIKGFGGFTKQNFSQKFIGDFNQNYISNYNSSTDSAMANTLKGAINSESGFGNRGNYRIQYGIAISPFPQKYGGLLLLLKAGTNAYSLYGTYTKKLFYNDAGNYMSFNLNQSYSIELTFKPYKFFNSEGVSWSNEKLKHIYRYIVLSLYFERLSLKGATLGGTSYGREMPISQMVNQNFISKYNNIYNFGFEVGFALY